MLNIIKKECPENRIKIKCPYSMTPTRIVIHNTANDASAASEISYMHKNRKEVSFHFAVDDLGVVQGIELNRNAWHASDGNGKGNREGIAIEVCYSKSGGERWLKAVENAAELTAQLLKEYGWGIDRVTKHEDYAKKHCPHRLLDEYGWDSFLELIKSRISDDKPKKPDVIYQVWDDVKNRWLPNVTNDSDYAGIFGHDVCAVLASLNFGNIFYRVHYKGGKWLPEVKNRSDYAGLFNKPIDGLMIRTDTDTGIYYRVHLRRIGKWLPWVTGYNMSDGNNGYAGIIGREIDGVQIKF